MSDSSKRCQFFPLFRNKSPSECLGTQCNRYQTQSHLQEHPCTRFCELHLLLLYLTLTHPCHFQASPASFFTLFTRKKPQDILKPHAIVTKLGHILKNTLVQDSVNFVSDNSTRHSLIHVRF